MTRSLRIALVLIAAAVLAQQAGAQESKAAKYTREKLKQVIADFEAKETGTKAFFEDVNRELETQLRFKIDGTSGISNNTKLTFKAKKITVEKLLNDLSDKYEFGWIVISNPGNNKEDGAILIRKGAKGKERGYEFGKEPKTDKTPKTSSVGPTLESGLTLSSSLSSSLLQGVEAAPFVEKRGIPAGVRVSPNILREFGKQPAIFLVRGPQRIECD